MPTRVRWILLPALVILVAVALYVWRGSLAESWWVAATVVSGEVVDESCGGLAGITDQTFSTTSHLPPGTPAEGVYWTVSGHRNAERIATCLAENGATNIRIEKIDDVDELRFENTGP